MKEPMKDTNCLIALEQERENAARICEQLAGMWEKSAAKVRTDGSFTYKPYWPFGKAVTAVRPGWERAAQDTESAAHGLRTVASLIRKGYRAES